MENIKMNKPVCVVWGPIGSVSGYGELTRQVAWQMIDLDEYEVKIVPAQWGHTPDNFLDASNARHQEIIKRILTNPQAQLTSQPALSLQCTIPFEFQRLGRVSIGVSAVVETNIIPHTFIDKMNQMDATFVISDFNVAQVKETVAEVTHQNGQKQKMQVTKPVETYHCCVDTSVFKKISSSEIPPSIKQSLLGVDESFCFLFVGHWLSGGLREDRKNVGLLLHLFCETFKGIPSKNRPALILKTSQGNSSILDREEILNRIDDIRRLSGPNSPNIYLVHGDLEPEEMNGLYNHPKVKAHISLTHGESFGIPLLEASLSEKPVLCSGWSGPLDFLNKDLSVLLAGELKQVHPGAVWKDVIIPESGWFNVDETFAMNAMMYVFRHYEEFEDRSKEQAKLNRKAFNYEASKRRLKELLDKYAPRAEEIPFQLPTLKRL